MKELFITNIAGKGELDSFSIPSIEAAHSFNIDFTLCGNLNKRPLEIQRSEEKKHNITFKHFDIQRNPFSLNNVKVLIELIRYINKEKFDVIHCNTPVGGMLGRVCGRITHVKKIIYTAHGFHFYKGAPLFNRTILKWAEKIMAHWTDAIITMNEEDYEAAKKFRLRNNGQVYKVHGVGIDLSEYNSIRIDKHKIRESLGLKDDDIVCISMGDLIKRKNYGTAISAIAKCKSTKVHYIICGTGPEQVVLQKLAESLDIQDRIHFLGFRSDIKELLQASDIFLFTTLQEGLPRSLMEAMASGLPCIVSKIRGNVDLIEEGKGGYLCEANNSDSFAEKLLFLIENPNVRKIQSNSNLERIKDFDVKAIKHEVREVYKEVLC